MLAFVLFLVDASADCASGSLSVWPPPGGALASGGELVLEADGSEQKRARTLRDGGAMLLSGTRQVPLQVVSTLVGSFERTQVVLRPAEPLPEGQAWTLALGGEPLVLYYDGKHQPVSWTIGPAPTAEHPSWTAAPTVIDKDRERFGCGPAVLVTLEAPVHDAMWLEARVWAEGSTERVTMRLPLQEGRAVLGHGMCSGTFALQQGRTYFADITAIDALGRRARADDSPIRFVAP